MGRGEVGGERVEEDGGREVAGCWWGVLLDCFGREGERGAELVRGRRTFASVDC